jgi:hypothetical protein
MFQISTWIGSIISNRLDPDPDLAKYLDPDPDSLNTDPKDLMVHARIFGIKRMRCSLVVGSPGSVFLGSVASESCQLFLTFYGVPELYSTLLHLPPFRFYFVGECWD